MMRLIVPAIVATTIVIDLSNKKPTPYVEVPLLTMYNPTYNMSMEGNAGLNLICKF
jgi:hypothetical protein